MRLTVLFLLILISANTLYAQPDDNLEFGPALITINRANTSQFDQSKAFSPEIFDGIMFRYNRQRIGIRVLVSYIEKSIHNFLPENGLAGGETFSFSRNIILGGGFQYSWFKKRDLLYSPVDVCYRYTFINGSSEKSVGSRTEHFFAQGNGIDAFAGLGIKVRIVKQLEISSELGYSFYGGVTNSAIMDGGAPADDRNGKYNMNGGISARLFILARLN